MLRIKLQINDAKIGDVGVLNTQEFNDEGQVKYEIFDCRGWDGRGSITDCPQIDTVWHHRSYGASSLTAAVMDTIGEEPIDHIYD